MLEPSQNSYPLLRQFREFYVEAARLRIMAKDAVSSADDVPVLTPTPAAATSVSQPVTAASSPKDLPAVSTPVTVSAVWQGMAEYLDRKLKEVKNAYAEGSVYYDVQLELVYIMAALADEIFLQLEWSGKSYWLDHLMEQHLFHTQIAGQEIFRRIDQLVDRQAFGAGELAAVYLIALALGFQGKYYRDHDRKTLEDYRKKLLRRLQWSDPELQQSGQQMFPEAYQHTELHGAPVRLPEPRTWWLAVAGIVAVWLIVSTTAWLQLTQTTRESLSRTSDALTRLNQMNAQAQTCDQCTSEKKPGTWWLTVTAVAAAGVFVFTVWLFRSRSAGRQFTGLLEADGQRGEFWQRSDSSIVTNGGRGRRDERF